MTDAAPASADWQRLDPRMLLVHPIRELVRFLPVLLGILVAGEASGDGPPWHYLGVLVPVTLGVLRYVTTGYRIVDGRVELRSGLLNRTVVSTPLDRVRSVDLTASPVHRLVGVTTLRIGTGVGGDNDQLDLDGLPAARARRLRAELLHATPEAAPPTHDDTLVRFDASWLRFAPFTGSWLAVAAAVIGTVSQLLNTLDAWDDVADAEQVIAGGVAVALLVVVGLVVVGLVAMLGYLVTNGGFRLTRAEGTWHVTRGLLTTRETTLDHARIAGVSLGEPLLLRAAGGAHLSAIVTGVKKDDPGSAVLVPPAPRELAPGVAATVLGSADPVTAPLVPHGPAAARRRWVRAVLPTGLVTALAVLATATGGAWWLPVPAALALGAASYVARDRVAGLGHALVGGRLVARSGSLARRRDVLATDHVIGWTLRDTWFQRRQGLTTLVATTAGGGGAVTVLDVTEPEAVLVACRAVPGLAEQFLVAPRG